MSLRDRYQNFEDFPIEVESAEQNINGEDKRKAVGILCSEGTTCD